MFKKFKRILIGRPMKSTEAQEQKLNNTKALAILSSDALSSIAYGPEQILIVLASVSIIAFWYSLPIAVGVLILLTALILSYRQIIYAYPNGGGAYMVAKENLGTKFGLFAGGSLLIDYVLTVAVSVSAGTDAIASTFPEMHSFKVWIAVGLVAFITLVNLRGLTESASILAYPVYAFVIALVILILTGLYQVLTNQATPHVHSEIGTPVMGISLFLILKAFSSGCSALTGVEAISNAVPNFKNPPARNAALTLTIMGIILGLLFSGIVFLSYWYGIAPTEKETVLSQLGSSIFDRNIFYYLVQATTALILILAANTAYAAFPLLAFNLAKDKYMPHAFKVRGDRLGYSNGIITLALASIFLIIIFKGDTESLIPLYAVGVFIPFSLSQTGMIVKWVKTKPKGWITKLAINLIGALICYLILIIFFVTKFGQVWMSLVFIPLAVYIFHKIHQHYTAVGNQLKTEISEKLSTIKNGENVVIVPVAGITKVVRQSILYAKTLSDNVVAVYVGSNQESIKELEQNWCKWDTGVKLVGLLSPYRSVLTPLSQFIDVVKEKADASHSQVTVIMPQFIAKRWWQRFLHNQSGFLIMANVLRRRNIIVTIVPYQLEE
jgi:amino acid transporter